MRSFGITGFAVLTKNQYTGIKFFFKVGDLISANALAFDCLHSGLNPEKIFFVMRIVNSIPSHWRLTIKTSTLPLLIDPIPYDPLVTLENKSIPILNVPSKHIYNFFQEKKSIRPSLNKDLWLST